MQSTKAGPGLAQDAASLSPDFVNDIGSLHVTETSFSPGPHVKSQGIVGARVQPERMQTSQTRPDPGRLWPQKGTRDRLDLPVRRGPKEHGLLHYAEPWATSKVECFDDRTHLNVDATTWIWSVAAAEALHNFPTNEIAERVINRASAGASRLHAHLDLCVVPTMTL